MTDNEIIKAWKCCVINSSCIGCPYKKHWVSCSSQCLDMRLEDTFNLINRQKAEIERLKANEEMAEGYADALVEYTKSEAYKEVVERLCEDRVSNDPVVIAAKRLLKEMEGENDEQTKKND